MVQVDSLRVDATASIDRAWDFHRTLDARAKAEARLLERHNANLVAGDIPPLAFAAAAEAGVATADGRRVRLVSPRRRWPARGATLAPHTPAETRRALGLPADRPLVLVSFGRYGLGAVDWATATQQADLASS